MKYRTKPVIKEAIQFTGTNSTEVEAWGVGLACKIPFGVKFGGKEMVIHTLEGDMVASPGDYIIQGLRGEFYPCKPDIFEKTYEKVE